jgi:hypothetical protein
VGKPIVVAEKVKVPFEDFVWKHFADSTGTADAILDTELCGRRRDGDAHAIFILDLLRVQGRDLYSVPFIDRIDVLNHYVPRDNPYRCPYTLSDFRAFWDYHKANTPLAEGVVLKHRSSKYIGSTTAAAKNPAWLKVRWRIGSSGLAPNE